ncbi:MAG: TIGR00730 family Rossman fold protein [Candidatus Micrarchaeia archaeon]
MKYKAAKPENGAGQKGSNGVGYKSRIFPPMKVIEEFARDMRTGTDRINEARKRPGFRGFVAVFGSSHFKPSDADYVLASDTSYEFGKHGYGTITGDGKGIMKAGNEGAAAAGAASIGLYRYAVGKDESMREKIQAEVHTMYSRKVLFTENSSAVIVFPGGYGTLDELFESLRLIQTGNLKGMQVILMGNEKYWKSLLKWLENRALGRGFINQAEFGLMKYAANPKEALKIIRQRKLVPISHDAGSIAGMFAQDMKTCSENLGFLAQKSASIFGSASKGFFDSIKEAASRLARQGYAIYSGGWTMDAVASGVLDASQKTPWPIPVFFMNNEKPSSIHVPLNMMASRKLILGSSDALVFYPGGYGTLDELFDYAVRVQIGDMERIPVITADRQFWEPLYHWIRKYPLEMGLIDRKDTGILTMANRPRDVIRIIMESQ